MSYSELVIAMAVVCGLMIGLADLTHKRRVNTLDKIYYALLHVVAFMYWASEVAEKIGVSKWV